MTTRSIDPEPTSFTVAFKPGMRATVAGVQGSFDATVADGTDDWDQPVAGAFEMHVDDPDFGNGVFTAGARAFLDRTRNTEIAGTPCEGPDGFTSEVVVTLAERTIRERGRVRFEVDLEGEMLLVAGTRRDPP